MRLSRVRARLRGRWRWIARVWRSSLRLRVVSATVAVWLIVLVGLGEVLSVQIRDGLFSERLEQVLADAALRADAAQRRFDASTANSTQDVQQLANDTVRALQETAAGTAAVVLLRSEVSGGPIHIVPAATDSSMREVISPELREQVAQGQFQQWQSVELVDAASPYPGVAVGSSVLLPGAGEHELYFIYSFAAEKESLWIVQRALLVGGAGLLLALLLVTWYLARQVLDPVRRASAVAAKLSAGEFSERMVVEGQDELASLAQSFNDMAQSLQDQIGQLAELSHMQQRFVSDVSHELRTPLTTIRMASELLHESRDELPANHHRTVELLYDQLDRFELLLADLLEISRFDAGAADLNTESTKLRDVVQRVVDLTAPIAAERGSELNVIMPDTPVPVEIDRRRIERVIRNLVINAIEHGEGKPITIELAADDHAAAVVVEDLGVGMTHEEAEHVFDRFWRADPARARTLGGTGLGLAISLEDARLHGGTLEATGTPGHGARFRLTLPRRIGMQLIGSPLPLQAEPDAEPVEERSSADPLGPASLPTLKGEL